MVRTRGLKRGRRMKGKTTQCEMLRTGGKLGPSSFVRVGLPLGDPEPLPRATSGEVQHGHSTVRILTESLHFPSLPTIHLPSKSSLKREMSS